jgi:hypothetical protein
MLLLYQYRSRESKVNDGKDKKDSRDYVVPPHFCWMCYADYMMLLVEYLSSQCKHSVSSVVKKKSVVAKSGINKSELRIWRR